MVMEILSNVLYNISLFGTIIAIIFSIVVISQDKKTFFGLGKFFCIFLIFTWISYIGMSVFNITTIKSTTDKTDTKKQGAYYMVKDKQLLA